MINGISKHSKAFTLSFRDRKRLRGGYERTGIREETKVVRIIGENSAILNGVTRRGTGLQ